LPIADTSGGKLIFFETMKQKMVFFLSLFLIVGGAVYAQKPTAAKSVGPRNAVTKYSGDDYTTDHYGLYDTDLDYCKIQQTAQNASTYNMWIYAKNTVSTDDSKSGKIIFYAQNIIFGDVATTGNLASVSYSSISSKGTSTAELKKETYMYYKYYYEGWYVYTGYDPTTDLVLNPCATNYTGKGVRFQYNSSASKYDIQFFLKFFDDWGWYTLDDTLTLPVNAYDYAGNKITLTDGQGGKSDFTMTATSVSIIKDKARNKATLTATADGKTATLEFPSMSTFDETIGVPAGTYGIGSTIQAGNKTQGTGSNAADASNYWYLSSGSVTITNNGNGTLSISTSSVKDADDANVSITATNITPSITTYETKTLTVNNASCQDLGGRIRIKGTSTDSKAVSVCYYSDNVDGTFDSDNIDEIEIAGVTYSVMSATVSTVAGGFHQFVGTISNATGDVYQTTINFVARFSEDNTYDFTGLTFNQTGYSEVSSGYRRLTAHSTSKFYGYYADAQIDFYVGDAATCEGIPSGEYTVSSNTTANNVAPVTSTSSPLQGSYVKLTNGEYWYLYGGKVTVVNVNGTYYVTVAATNSNYTGNPIKYRDIQFTIGTAPTSCNITIASGDGGSSKITLPCSGASYTEGTHSMYVGQTISLEATANDGYEFDQWNDGNKDNPRQITVSSAATYTASFKATSTGLTLKDNEDNTATLTSKDGQTMDVTINRTIKAGMWNTICLPFALSSLVSTPLAGAQLGTLTQAETVDDELILDFATTATTVAAGQPYIIKLAGASDLVNPTFTSVTIDKSNADYTVDEIDFKGIYSPTALEATDLFLGVNNTVHNPNVTESKNTMNGFRAYFHYTSKAGIPRRIRMVVNSSETTTALDDFSAENVITKTLENGRLVIIRDGVRYDAQGHVMK